MATQLVDLRRDTAGSGATAAPGLLFRVARAGVRISIYLGVGAVALAALLLLVLAAGPNVLPYRAYTIESGSMTPTLPIGSEVILAKTSAAQLKVGDVITFREPTRAGNGQIITHRIVRIERRAGKRLFVTKGDANGLPDAWRVPATGEGWRYAFKLPYLGYGIEALKLPLVRFAMLALAALTVAVSTLRWVWRPSES
jgi:signal peptidase I